MSNWPGNLIRKTPVIPAGPFQNSAASGVWSLAEAAYWQKQGLWPIPGNLAPIGLFGGQTNVIDQVNIASTSNATDFGDLVADRQDLAGCSSSTRGIFGGGNFTSVIQYVTFATAGNATSFGNLSAATGEISACSNAIRGLFGGGYVLSQSNKIDYITIATTGNSTDFGDLTISRSLLAGCASSTRGMFGGGVDSNPSNTARIDYVTIATTGNAVTFGNLTAARKYLASTASETRGLWAGGTTTGNIIDYVTIASTGNATDFGDLPAATQGLAGCASPTRALFGGGNDGTTSNVITYVTIASTGNAADFGDLTQARIGLAACSSAASAVQPTPTSSAMALFGGGVASPGGDNQAGIQYVNIATTGDAYFFGQLTVDRYELTAFASSTRGVFAGGDRSGAIFFNVIDYVTFASLGSATTFGTLTANGRYGLGGASNETRGLAFAGYNASTGPGFMNVIDYVTIATTGNATDFGDTTVLTTNCAACASTTRATVAGGYDGSNSYLNIGYVTIATTGNATSFGNLSVARFFLTSCSSSTRGLFAGGRTSPGSGFAANDNTIDYITIASTGNATDFGDLTVRRAQLAGASSATIGVFAGGQNTSGARVNTIDYVTIASTGNATDFGDLSAAISQSAGCSNAHGGL